MLTSSERKRFWSQVAKAGKDECWLWTGKKFRRGYGRFNWKRKGRRTHRISMMEFLGRKLKRKEWVLHKCDNPPCVNPRHLYLGDTNDNMKDMVERGRSPRGTRHPNCKLSEAEVAEIRKLYRPVPRYGSLSKLAKIFGVTNEQIGHIVHGRQWKHLP